VQVNQLIALLLEDGEDESALDEASDTAAPAAPKAAEPAVPAAPEAPTAPAAPAPAAAATPVPPAPIGADGARIFSSPLARRMAQQAGLELTGIAGSGPNGRIVKRDIEAALAGGAPAPAIAPATAPTAAVPVAAPADGFEPAFDYEPASTMRKIIAARLTESKQTVPHFYLTIDCEIDKLLALRKELNARSDDYRISVNDLVLKACGVALRRVPTANASWTGEGIKFYRSADIAVAVAIEGGLITPVVRDAGGKGLEAISNEMRDLAGRARDGKLMPEDYQGGTFSVSNLGMFGIKQFEAVINPPQGCILAVGAGEARPVVHNGALAVATVMSVTLSVDHRAVDGAVGAEFLAAFKALVEDPMTMLL
jgi:pyruvate dehydrogenase E2 component (dihydrolipoamide acetyltransferase)